MIGCSTDSHFTHLAWINTDRKNGGLGKLNYPLLADKSMSVARNYGVLNEESGIPFRGLFIIDREQNLRQITINDLPVGRSVDETLRLVQAFQVNKFKVTNLTTHLNENTIFYPQYTDVNGEVCPANWKPGSKTMVADPQKAKEYFGQVN